MSLLEKVSYLMTAKKLKVEGQPDLVNKISYYISNYLNPNINFIEGESNILVIKDITTFEDYVNKIEDDNCIYVIDLSIVSIIYNKFPLLYIQFEEKMKEYLKNNDIDKKLIKFIYADIFKEVILESFEIFSINTDNKNFKIDKQQVRCAWPWYNMYIRGNTLEWCCGYSHTQEKQTWDENTGKLNILKEWSSEPFQKVRDVLTTKDTEANCSKCHNLYFEQFFPYIFDFLSLNKEQQENVNKVIYNYWMKNKVLDSYPIRYEIITSYKCNINCIMCNQEEYNKLKYELPVSVILDNKKNFQKAVDISLLGGEFFAIKNAKEILEIFASKDFENVRFLFITNGTLIHRYFDQLKKLKNIIISFSLDTIGENYEYIREGANWNKVEKNILDFLEMYKEEKIKNPSLNWQIQSPSIMMKSSVKSLLEYVKWCIEHNIQPAFIKLEPYGVNVDQEDIFRNKRLLNEIEEWENIFEESLFLLKEKHFYHSFNTLNEIYKQLK
ncbi:MAG: radical SAM protein [Halarcobacter sp.]